MRISVFTDKVVGRISDELDRRAHRAGHMIRDDVLVRLSGKRGGRLYTVPATKSKHTTRGGKRKLVRRGGVKYRASRPGEAPAAPTGALRQSIRVVVHRTPRTARAEVGTDKLYGVFLEKGTRKMAPRPFLKPALDAQRGAIINMFAEPMF